MNKKVKIVLGALLALILIGGGVTWYAASRLDTAQLTSLISSSVKSATGRDLKIAGSVTLSLFPRIAVSAEQVSLSNAPWSSEPNMLTLKRLEMDIKTLPLLSGRVEIGSIKLDGVSLYLQKTVAGKANWDMSESANGAADLTGGDATSAADANASLISIENIAISDARIQYQDGAGPIANYQIQNLSISESGNKASVSLTAKSQQTSWSVSGKTGSISKAIKEWDVVPSKFIFDLNVGINSKSMLIKGDVAKLPKSAPSFDISVVSKSIDWPQGPANSHSQASPQASGRAALASTPSRSSYLFSNDELPLDIWPQAKGVVNLDIGELGLPARQPIQNIKAKIRVDGGIVDIPDLTFQLGQGYADIRLNIAQRHSPNPVLTYSGVTREFTLEGLLARLDPSSKVSGGNMKLAFDMKSSGKSLHQIAGTSTGKIQLSIEQAKMGSNFLNDAGDFVITVLDSMNPLRKKSQGTVLECAVAYLPMNNGLISIDNSVGMETDRLNVVLAGSINLKTEAVNLTVDPREKSGLTTGLDLAGLVKVGGTLTNPKAVINQSGVINSAVSIGLGVLTGGASILAENARSMANKSHPCREALRPWSDIYPGAK